MVEGDKLEAKKAKKILY